MDKSREKYIDFVIAKSHLSGEYGFEPIFSHPDCYPFQSYLIEWAVRSGRAAIFADCGLGKTLMQLCWAQNVFQKEGRPVLILSPLSVSLQTEREAAKFGFECSRSLAGKIEAPIVTSNYERLHHFDPNAFSGVVCDESSILKNFDGIRRGQITDFMRRMKFRLLCTATAAPNDYTELGTSSEALGHLGHMDMLGRFFKNDEKSLHPAFIGSAWRLKKYAEHDFWRWICSWARACQKPSDLGFDDGPFKLPPLIERDHVAESSALPGQLFAMKAVTLDEQRKERRATINERCEIAANLVDHDRPSVSWCQLNAEGDALERMIKGAVQIKGGDPEERKEEIIEDFVAGRIKKLVTKPKIAAFGMNWQHCAHMTYFPDHSFEQYYQSTRRFWRFGQIHPVVVDNIVSTSNADVGANMRRKDAACKEMFASLVRYMTEALNISIGAAHKGKTEVPSWLS